ncbi:MAG: hypothetical protein NZZ41_05060 [Candidatus Dojkabacteria bacterium]|nr:hypothetical protein [Candidatus Dojkabacteria bacterium]
MIVHITLTVAGNDTGPFGLYSNTNGFISPFEIVTKAQLLAGYTSYLVPSGTTVIRVKSENQNCSNYIDLVITTTTTTTTSTTTTTTTLAPYLYTAYLQACGGTTCSSVGSEVIVQSPVPLSTGLYSEGSTPTVYLIVDSVSGGTPDFIFTNPVSRSATYCCT